MDKMVSLSSQNPPDEAEAVVTVVRLRKSGLTFCFSRQIQTSTGEVVITNDGATILKHMAVLHPAARMVRQLHVFFSPRQPQQGFRSIQS